MAKCKHTGLCTYESATVFVPAIGGFHVECDGSSQMPGQMRCDDCGEVVGLGESYDVDNNVQLEIRGAHLVDDYLNDTGEWHGLVSLGMCSPGAEHADVIERDIEEGRKCQRDLDDYYAGHLARCIAEHTEES